MTEHKREIDFFLHQLLSLPKVFDARISPDGKWVAFEWYRIHENLDVFVVPADGSAAPVALTHTPEFTVLVNWTFDSQAVIVSEDHDSDERNPPPRRWWSAAEADRQEEAHQEQVLEGEQPIGQLYSPRVSRQKQTGYEGTEVRLDSDRIECLGPDPHRQGESEQHDHLATAAAVEHPANERKESNEPGDEGQRPPGGVSIPGDDKESDGGDVLKDENPNGDPACQGTGLGGFLQSFDGKDRVRKGQGEAHGQSCLEVHVGSERRSQAAGPYQNRRRERRTGYGEHDRRPPHLATNQSPRP